MIVEGGIERLSLATRRGNRKSLKEQSGSLTDYCDLDWENVGNDPHIDEYHATLEFVDENEPPVDQEECIAASSIKRRAKRVRFARALVSSIVELEASNHSCPDEIWYSKEEFARATTHLQALVQAARRDKTVISNTSPPLLSDLRGLENMASAEAYYTRQETMSRVWRGVFEEQSRQFRSKQPDHELIGLESEKASKDSRDRAQQRGGWDAITAQQAHEASE